MRLPGGAERMLPPCLQAMQHAHQAEARLLCARPHPCCRPGLGLPLAPAWAAGAFCPLPAVPFCPLPPPLQLPLVGSADGPTALQECACSLQPPLGASPAAPAPSISGWGDLAACE